MESLLSDKDSQIALLEVFGAKSQQQVERLDILRSDRSKLNQRLKVEVIEANEFRILFQTKKKYSNSNFTE